MRNKSRRLLPLPVSDAVTQDRRPSPALGPLRLKPWAPGRSPQRVCGAGRGGASATPARHAPTAPSPAPRALAWPARPLAGFGKRRRRRLWPPRPWSSSPSCRRPARRPTPGCGGEEGRRGWGAGDRGAEERRPTRRDAGRGGRNDQQVKVGPLPGRPR